MSGSVVRSPARGDREDCSQSSVSSVAVSSGRCETPDRQDDFADFDLKIGDYVLPTHVPFRQPVVAFDQKNRFFFRERVDNKFFMHESYFVVVNAHTDYQEDEDPYQVKSCPGGLFDETSSRGRPY